MVERVKRRWDVLAIALTGLLCIAFVVAMFQVAAAFHDTRTSFLHKEAANTAVARIAACELANQEQRDAIVGNTDGAQTILAALTEGRRLTVAQRTLIANAVVAYEKSQERHHTLRDCTPAGIDRSLHQPLGATAAALRGGK